MKATLLFTLLFLSFHTFAQFRHEQSANGNPLTEIIDPTGMKQGDWNYIDSDNRHFRTERFKDHVLVSNLYKTALASADLSGYQQKRLSDFSQQPLKDLAQSLAAIGHGEIIVLEDKRVFIHFYYDQVKQAAAIAGVNADILKKYPLQKTIIFF